MREALYYSREDGYFQCRLCPHNCKLKEGQKGLCRSRGVVDGAMVATAYAEAVSVALDPIEKKPLYHFNPGSQIVSLGPNACNLSCAFCQNWEISQRECSTQRVETNELAALVRRYEPRQVAFTYSEPTMWYEYIIDFAILTPDASIVLVSNAYLNEEPWQNQLPHVAAMNIDLKSIRNEFYKNICNGNVETVKANIKSAVEAGVHVELTNLVIPGFNDTETEINELAAWVAGLNRDIPLHFSAYRPCYKMTARATTATEVEHACEIASGYLTNVYAGNVYSKRFGRKH